MASFLFFAGKGGVGKTAVSCTTAVWLARQGLRTLLITTDPAAHIGDVLGVTVDPEPGLVAGVPGLWAARVDPKAAAAAYVERVIGDAIANGRGEDPIAAMREELDSPCTEEIAAFNRFIDLISRDTYDVTVIDTAPPGTPCACSSSRSTGAASSMSRSLPRSTPRRPTTSPRPVSGV